MPVPAFIATLIQAAESSVGSAFAQQAAVIAVNAIWQGAVIACGLAICLRLSPRTSAEHRFAIWTAAFAILVGLPFVTLVANTPATAGGAASFATPASAARALLSIDTRWSLLIAALWAAVTLFRVVDLVIHSFRLSTLWREAVPVELESKLTDLLAGTKAIWKRGTVEVCTTTLLQRPSVIGFFKPRILIPDWLFTRLTPGELEQIVLHEAEHLRRRDDWTNLLQKLCLVVFPLNPALLFIERRLCREREMACDEGVIKITNAPRAYAACLTSLAERGLQRRSEALSLGAWQRRPELVHRVHSILRRKRTLGPLGTRTLLGTLGCSLLFGSIGLARCPQLIAFVPHPHRDSNLGSEKLAAQASQLRQPARLLDASYVAPRGAAGSHTLSGAHMTNPGAVLPANVPAQSENAQASMQLTVARDGQGVAGKTPSYKPAAHAPQPLFLKSEMSRSQSAPVQQQWVVFTAWEQFQTPTPNAGPAANGLTADYETSPNAGAATAPSAAGNTGATTDESVQPKSLPAKQITVTRLIFRFFPASSTASQPALVPLRNGWFVIQL